MTTETSDALIHIVCPACGAVNRAAIGHKAQQAKCGKCHAPLFAKKPLQATLESFDRNMSRNDIPVVVDFWAEWCGPCHAMAPIYERAAQTLEPDYRFLKVDVDAEPALSQRYQIRSIPTLMLFRHGKPVAQRAGAVDFGTLQSWLKANSGT